ncbi:DUF7882 family protein [Cryobacterium tepidiphilum]|uniref:DUF7882 domain-containing protein n=1 Tax=Cryobacterium tepidiphilum TaxID=2486026 RepID=A0A3M8LDR7_9MICO|nr:hypothetical protein [Cryobacterium tepidiphilum]RNE62628.1 hypothetical protein EEJ31_07320 [Cryobacterium tepidiphilum]
MGKLIYGSPGTAIEIEDRALAHLKVAMLAKLRRDEKFALSWQHGAEGGGGRSTVWVHPSIPLQFIFNGGKQPTLNKAWVELLVETANSGSGIQLLPEPVDAE